MQGDENHVDQRPNSQAPETEELPDTLLPVAEIESVHSETTQSDAEDQRRGPFVTLRPVALDVLLERAMSQAENVAVDGAVRAVEGVQGVAVALLDTRVFPVIRLVAVPTFPLPDEWRRVPTLDATFGTTSRVQGLSVVAGGVVLALDAGKVEFVAVHVGGADRDAFHSLEKGI